MIRKHNFIIPALVAGILAGCSGGSTTPGASGTSPVLAATTGSATSPRKALGKPNSCACHELCSPG